jgi:hypothetical protein
MLYAPSSTQRERLRSLAVFFSPKRLSCVEDQIDSMTGCQQISEDESRCSDVKKSQSRGWLGASGDLKLVHERSICMVLMQGFDFNNKVSLLYPIIEQEGYTFVSRCKGVPKLHIDMLVRNHQLINVPQDLWMLSRTNGFRYLQAYLL